MHQNFELIYFIPLRYIINVTNHFINNLGVRHWLLKSKIAN